MKFGLQKAAFKQFNVRLSAKEDNYNDESRMRYITRSLAPLNYADHVKRLAKELQEAGEAIPVEFPKEKYL